MARGSVAWLMALLFMARFFGHDRQPAVLLRKFITCIEMDVYGKEGRNGVLCCFQQLRSYRDNIETSNREEISISSQIVPRGLSVSKGP